MIPGKQRIAKAIAVSLVYVMIQMSAVAGGSGSPVYAQDTAARRTQASGVLTTTNNKNVMVDKSEVTTGATILSGVLLETVDCVAATVRWGLEEVNLASNSSAVIERSEGKVRVILKQGCASVRVGPNVEATIETPDGKVTTATDFDSSNRKYAQVCVGSAANYDFNPACTGFAKTGWILAGVAGAIALVALLATGSRGGNPSPSTP